MKQPAVLKATKVRLGIAAGIISNPFQPMPHQSKLLINVIHTPKLMVGQKAEPMYHRLKITMKAISKATLHLLPAESRRLTFAMKAGALYQAVRKANLKVVLWRVQILKSTEYQ